jgi:hypothetical protein
MVRKSSGSIPSELYEGMLTADRGWTRHIFDLPDPAAGRREKRWMQEVLWLNDQLP